jgi:hypothetical protein
MAIAVQQIYPVAHLPLILGVFRRLEVATLIDQLIPPHPAHGLSCGRGVEALVLAILDGHHALYKVGKRLEERGMVPLPQPGLTRAGLNDYRLGHILDALFAANLNQVFSVVALKALEVYALPAPWLHQDTTTIALYGAYADEPHTLVLLGGKKNPFGVRPSWDMMASHTQTSLPTAYRSRYVWSHAPCSAPLGGGAPGAPHADPCAQDASTPEFPGPGDPAVGRGPVGSRRGTPPRHDTHHGPALASSLAHTPWRAYPGTLTRRPATRSPGHLQRRTMVPDHCAGL